MTCLPKIAALLSLLSPRNGRPLKMQPLLCGGGVSKWLNIAVSHSRSPRRAGTMPWVHTRRHAPARERVPPAYGRRTPTHGGSATAAAPVCYQARGTFTPEEDAGDEPWEEEALEQRLERHCSWPWKIRLRSPWSTRGWKGQRRRGRRAGRGSEGGGRMVTAHPSWQSGVTPYDPS